MRWLSDFAISLALIHLATFFSAPGLAKSFAPRAFADLLAEHRVIPPRASHATAVAVIAAELSLGIWLISGVAYRIAAIGAAVMLGSFVMYHFALRTFGAKGAPCGCLGDAATGQQTSPAVTGLVMNLVLALAVAAFGTGFHHYSLPMAVVLSSLLILGLVGLAARRRRAFAQALKRFQLVVQQSP